MTNFKINIRQYGLNLMQRLLIGRPKPIEDIIILQPIKIQAKFSLLNRSEECGSTVIL